MGNDQVFFISPDDYLQQDDEKYKLLFSPIIGSN